MMDQHDTALRENRANLVSRLAAATRQLMFTAGMDLPTFETRRVECASLRAAIADVNLEIERRNQQMRRKPYAPKSNADQPRLVVHQHEGVPFGSCSFCSQINFAVILIGTSYENLADLRDQFRCHRNAVHPKPVKNSELDGANGEIPIS